MDTLPTITNFLASSLKPFECGLDFDELKEAFQRANPGLQTGYTLSQGDVVYNKIRTLLYNCRGWFPLQAAQVLLKFFNTDDEFAKAEDPVTAISAYVAYALRPDGPMLYRTPAPRDIRPGQPGYTAPKGYCESAFVVDVLKPFMKKLVGSRDNYGRLHGAIGLTAAALEKQFRMWATGDYVANTEDFSRETAGDTIDDYIDNTRSFPNHRWKLINELCGVVIKNTTPIISTSSKTRRSYVPSSP